MTTHNTLLGNFPYHVLRAKSDRLGMPHEECQWCMEKFGATPISLPSYAYSAGYHKRSRDAEGVWVYDRGVFMFKNPSHAVEFKLRFG